MVDLKNLNLTFDRKNINWCVCFLPNKEKMLHYPLFICVFLDDQAQFAEFVKKSNSSGQQGAGSAKRNRNVIVLPKSSRREVKVPLKYRGNIHTLRKHILGAFRTPYP